MKVTLLAKSYRVHSSGSILQFRKDETLTDYGKGNVDRKPNKKMQRYKTI